MYNIQKDLSIRPAGHYELEPPIHPLLRGIDVALDPIMQTISRGLLHHHWHWDRLAFDKRFADFAIRVPHGVEMNTKNDPAGDLLYWIRGHLGAINMGYLIDVDIDKLPKPFELERFFYAFSDTNQSYLMRSRIAMDRMFMILSGSSDWYAYLMDRNGNPLPGKLYSELISWDEKPTGVAIL